MGIKVPIDQGIITQASNALKVVTGQATPWNQAWFGPLSPPLPIVPGGQKDSVIGRRFDFPAGYNTRMRPRADEAVSFAQMRGLAEACDLLRMVIETRKDQICGMEWTITNKDGVSDADARCDELIEFFKKPDGQNDFSTWLRMLMEEMLVTDSMCIWPWLNNDNTPYRFEVIDGTTIKCVIDERGRTPEPPYPAYQQVLKGITAVDYTALELIYMPRNKRVHKVYGYSPVEQIIITVNIAIRRAMHQMQYYTEGSTPDLIFAVPQDWQMAQIKDFSDWWQDSLAGKTAERRKVQFVPGGVTPINTKDAILKDTMDEWLARIICYCFSISPQPFVKENNRATADTAQEVAIEEGLMPLMKTVKALMDTIIGTYFGYKDIEFCWAGQDSTDPHIQNEMDDTNLKNGSRLLNEVRAARGDPPVPGGDVPMVLTATGYVPLIQEVLPETPISEPTVTPGSKDKQDSSMVNTPESSQDEPKTPTSSEEAQKVMKSGHKLKPINRDTPARAKALKKFADEVHKALVSQAQNLIKKLTKLQKIDSNSPIDDIKWDGWDRFDDLFDSNISLAASNGVLDAKVQINLDDEDVVKLANESAIEYASARAAQLVGKQINSAGELVDNPDPEYSIEEATREMIRADVTNAMESGATNDELADTIMSNYAFSESRAQMIARTETAYADIQGNLALYKESGEVDAKTWIVGDGCCDECQALDGETVPIDENFSDGSDGPPAHPECRCDLLPVLSSPSEIDE